MRKRRAHPLILNVARELAPKESADGGTVESGSPIGRIPEWVAKRHEAGELMSPCAFDYPAAES